VSDRQDLHLAFRLINHVDDLIVFDANPKTVSRAQAFVVVRSRLLSQSPQGRREPEGYVMGQLANIPFS